MAPYVPNSVVDFASMFYSTSLRITFRAASATIFAEDARQEDGAETHEQEERDDDEEELCPADLDRCCWDSLKSRDCKNPSKGHSQCMIASD